jgi:hypothetical protein
MPNFSSELMADTPLIGTLNSKFWWDLYIFPYVTTFSLNALKMPVKTDPDRRLSTTARNNLE